MNYSYSYPYVNPKWLLHHLPQGGLLKPIELSDERADHGIWELTPLAVRTLLLCDGTRTLQQILEEIHLACEGRDFSPAESAAHFMVSAQSRGVLRFQEKAAPQSINANGSTEKYHPLHLAIELTDACNLHCKHCYRVAGEGKDTFFPTDELIRILGDMRKKGVHSLELSGGEPTTHPDFATILKFALQNFGAVSVLTNGTMLSDRLFQILKDHTDKVMVQVSLDGCCADEHDELRGSPGAFEKSVSNIRRLTELGIKVRVAMVIYPKNVHSVEKTYELAMSLGAKWFACSPVLEVGRATPDILLTIDQLNDVLERIDLLVRQDADTIITADELKRLSGELGNNCGAGSRALALGPDGQIRPCFVVNKKVPAFSNVLKQSTDNVLESAPLLFLHSLQPPGPELCGDCEFGSFCNGCLARPLLAWERALKKDTEFSCLWSEVSGFGKTMGISPNGAY